MNLQEINLLGIDVGFSDSRPTTGIAWSLSGKIDAARTHTDWQRRERVLPPGASFTLIAIDGPLVSQNAPGEIVRTCEQILSRGTFQKRCKPGASHFGTGLKLRQAAAETARQFGHLGMSPSFENAVFRETAIVEAFPNAFLGVMLDDSDFGAGRIARGKKFDHMYERVVASGRISALLEVIAWRNQALIDRMEADRDHERRAALVCLITAACAASGKATSIGDSPSGWIWLPPLEAWADWARQALEMNLASMSPMRPMPAV